MHFLKIGVPNKYILYGLSFLIIFPHHLGLLLL